MQHLQIHTFRPKGASSTKTMDQALQPFAKKRHREGTAWPARMPSYFEWGPWRVQLSGWEDWLQPLEDAAGALLRPRGLGTQDGPDGLVEDGFEASLGEG